MKFRYLPGARRELREAMAYYHRARSGLGLEFRAEVDKVIQRILRNPRSCRPFLAGSQRGPTARFPYGVVYFVKPSGILIVAVMHLRRRPDYWLDRLDEA